MQLLVSVRDAAEAVAALGGGADIIDAKEPRHGALGAVTPATLLAIAATVPPHRSLSVALGDVLDAVGARAVATALALPARRAPSFFKLGCAGVADAAVVREALTAAREVVHGRAAGGRLIAVAYADAAHTGSLDASALLDVAAEAGADGVLLDTAWKGAGTLLDLLEPAALRAWVMRARRHGLLVALAGSVGVPELAVLVAMGADIIGVRGAAAEGGRDGTVSAARVRALRVALHQGREGAVESVDLIDA